MTHHDELLTRVRHLILVAIVAAVALAGPFGVVTGTAVAQQDADDYAVIQGEDCITIDPVGEGHLSVEEFYDYRDPNTSPSSYSYSSHGTRHLQVDDTSTIFLHEGSDGLSLVVVHDRYGGSTDGGAVTMTFTDLPEEGEWVVEDDSYGDRDDEFSHNDASSRITWVYGEGRTDGAAFNGGLDDEFAITVTPRFNSNAAYQEYDGRITDWEVVSATGAAYERTSLDMSQPIEIRSTGCSSYAVTELTVDETVSAGDSVDVEATVENDGVENGTFTVPITVDDDVVEEHEVILEPGEAETIATTVTLEDADTYEIGVGSETAEVTAEGEDGSTDDEDDSDELPGFGVTAVALAALFAALLARYRRQIM